MNEQKNKTNFFALESLQKILVREWNFPPVERFMPGFYVTLGGFVVASAMALIASSSLMPSHNKSGKNKERTTSVDVGSNEALPNPVPLMADFTNISSRNIFNSEGSMADSDGAKPVCELKKSELPLKFTGIISGGTAQTSLVVIESGSSASAEAFLLYDMAPGQIQIVDITRNRVFLERNGCLEYLELESVPLPKKRVAGNKPTKRTPTFAAKNSNDAFREDGFERSGNKIQVERRWVDKALGIDFAKTLQDAKANPNLVGTEIKGFTLTKIRPNSAYEKMGLQDGDIVKSINSIELSGMAQAVQTLNQMRNENMLTLVIERAGQTLNLNVDVRR